MRAPFWSDEDRPFIFWSLGLSFNFKWAARRLGLIKPSVDEPPREQVGEPQASPRSREERLRDQVEASKYEERR